MTMINTVRTNPENEPGLQYNMLTNPYPLRVSPPDAGEGSYGQLTIVASRAAHTPLLLRKLSVKIPAGTGASDLALSLDGVESTISLGWRSDVSGDWIEFTPSDPYAEIADEEGVTVIIGKIPINREAGAVALIVEEDSAEKPPNGPPDWKTREVTLSTGKFPLDFYLDNFMADKQQISNGGDVTLTWKRSAGANTTLLYGNRDPIDVRDYERYKAEDIRETTTFYLIGSVAGAEIVRSAMVTVLNPDLVVNKLTVNDTLTVAGAVTVDDTLAVAGALTAGDTLAVAGALTVDDALAVAGAVTIGDALTANGEIDFPRKTRWSQIKWDKGQLPMWGNRFKAVAPTRGLLYVSVTLTRPAAGQAGRAQITVTHGPVSFCSAEAPNHDGACKNSATLPVLKDTNINAYVYAGDAPDLSNVDIYLEWHPFGVDADLDIIQMGGPETAAHQAPQTEPLPVPGQAAPEEARETI